MFIPLEKQKEISLLKAKRTELQKQLDKVNYDIITITEFESRKAAETQSLNDRYYWQYLQKVIEESMETKTPAKGYNSFCDVMKSKKDKEIYQWSKRLDIKEEWILFNPDFYETKADAMNAYKQMQKNYSQYEYRLDNTKTGETILIKKVTDGK